MTKEELKELLYKKFMEDDGDGWTPEQEERIEHCLQDICEEYLGIYCKMKHIPMNVEDLDKMNSTRLIENKYILRSVEMLVGAVTEERIQVTTKKVLIGS